MAHWDGLKSSVPRWNSSETLQSPTMDIVATVAYGIESLKWEIGPERRCIDW